MKFGVSLSAIAQQPAGADMQQAFADICAYVGAARDLGSTWCTRVSTT